MRPIRNFTTVIDALRAAALVHGDRAAFVGGDAIAYGDFYRRVRHWAQRFARAGLARGERVAIWAPKSDLFVTAIYATMEAGAAYVPLDGAQPAERGRKIVASAEPTILVTDRERFDALAGDLPASLRLVLLLDGEGGDWPVLMAGVQTDVVAPLHETPARAASLPEPARVGPDDIAAILFTSGSTGMPKGVQISYKNLNRFIGWAVEEFDLTANDVLVNHAGFHFDLSTFDLFAAATVGAAVWIVRENEQRDIYALANGLSQHRATTLYCVPSLLTMLASSGALTPAISARLERVLFAGEPFPIKHLRTLAKQLPPTCALYNLYGPTETNVCTFHKVRPSDLEQERPIPIGLPLPEQIAMVIDGEGRPVEKDGEIGELIVAGDCVTAGYFNRIDPANHDNHRTGRHATGDLVTRENGLLYYCGRKDRMLKINGNRVELGEIEAALSRHPAILEAAAIGVVTETGQTLAAFYSVRPGAAPPGAIEIKRHCGAWLPRYMIPHLARHLDALPKNANGKIDYLALRHVAEHAIAGPGLHRTAPAMAS
ncbi:AMP-binding protein [Methylocystis sp. JR02]|uniref:AMP-binding protein n=1 Tax=Methylocystis sp. JR02 TaxID=3046284 RepID=UPI0024BBE335|nr:AMP-binding protein [Methylocystis sp. JR02]MDJ0450854.1 AMP-binding protein [Methylocystis sp. JR02]